MGPLRRIVQQWKGLLANARFSNGLYLIFTRLFFSKSRFVPYLWNDRYWVVCDRLYHEDLEPKESFIKQVYHESVKVALSRSDREAGFAYLDVGAFIGGLEISIDHLVPKIRSASCFELNPSTFKKLQYTLLINGMDYVQAHPFGLGANDGSFEITEHRMPNGRIEVRCFGIHDAYTRQAEPGRRGATLHCEVRSFNTTVRTLFPPDLRWDLLKLDCEGSEYEIIASAESELLQRFGAIVMEVHTPPEGHSLEAMERRLGELGFQQHELRETCDPAVRLYISAR